MKFSGKKVLITGAASGIGLAQTKAFLAEGAQVVAVDLQEFTDESVSIFLKKILYCIKLILDNCLTIR